MNWTGLGRSFCKKGYGDQGVQEMWNFIAIDSSEDDEINIKGLEGYEVESDDDDPFATSEDDSDGLDSGEHDNDEDNDEEHLYNNSRTPTHMFFENNSTVL